MPDEYLLQIQTGLLVTGRKWCDFISICCGMPLFVKRVLPNTDIQKKIVARAIDFEDTVRQYMSAFRKNANNQLIIPKRVPEVEMFV